MDAEHDTAPRNAPGEQGREDEKGVAPRQLPGSEALSTCDRQLGKPDAKIRGNGGGGTPLRLEGSLPVRQEEAAD